MTATQHILHSVLNLPIGAKWLKADLHIHTPASTDFKGSPDTTPRDIVDAAIEKELDIIAITDHNTVDWCDKVREAAEGTPLTVFPGVELSTSQGHVLVLFDIDAKPDAMKDFLISAQFLSNQMGDVEHSTELKISEVAEVATKHGGIAIAAHADKNRGFLKTVPIAQDRRTVYRSQDLWAIEITDPESRVIHQSGKYYPPRRMTCLQFSDSHRLGDDIGTRCTFLKMGERNIGGLKLALLDPDIRVRFYEDELPSPESLVLGMWMTEGFLRGQKMRFNDGVNCLIGDTGSGKSLTIELIRFTLDQQPIVPKIQQEVESLLEQQLRNTGTVHVLLQIGSTRYLVERTWSDSPPAPFVQRINDDGSLSSVDSSDIREFFPIKCFSQSEIIEFARDKKVRLSLTDDLIDISEELASIDLVKGKLEYNAASIISEENSAESIRKQIARRPTLAEDLSRVDSILPQDRIKEQELWYKEQKLLDHANEEIKSLPDKLADAKLQLGQLTQWGSELDGLPNRSTLSELEKALQTWKAQVLDSQQDLTNKLNELIRINTAIRQDWYGQFENKEADYKSLLEKLDTSGRGLPSLAEYRKNIQNQISVLDEKSNTLKEEVLPRIVELKQERNHLLSELQKYRRVITGKREKKAEDLTEKLKDNVRLKVHARQNTELFERSLTEIAQGSRLGTQNVELLRKCHPVSFVRKMLDSGFDDLSDEYEVPASKLETLSETILDRNRLNKLYDLQLIDVDDVIEVQLEVKQGSYRKLEELSHGQKCRVVLMVALAEGDFPLLVDQPEDALHAPGIEEGIVSNLRTNRGKRQCIFATRNANILVSADTEQILALEADAENGRVRSTGSLDSYNHKRLVIYHVEGGRDAFRRRNALYTLRHSLVEEE